MSKEGGYLCGIAIVLVSLYTITLLFVPKEDDWIIMSGIAIGTFIISLYWMNHLTDKSKKEVKKIPPEDLLAAINNNIEEREQLEKIKRQLKTSTTEEEKGKLNEQIESKEKIIKLKDKRIEVLSEEPVGVLDKHEIRRSLTISLTIVYFMLLFFTVFSPVTTTTQVLNTTDMIPGDITGKITVGNVSIIVATETNITLNQTTHTTPNLQSPFVELFTYVYLAVITFYFGSRVIESYIAKKK